MAGCVRISKYPCFKEYFSCCSSDTLNPYVATVFVILQSLTRVKWSSMALPWLIGYQGGNAEWAWSNPVRCRVFIDSFLLTHSSRVQNNCPSTVRGSRQDAFAYADSSHRVPGRVLQWILVFRVLESGEYLSCSADLLLCDSWHIRFVSTVLALLQSQTR
jgi:hypothetical protein